MVHKLFEEFHELAKRDHVSDEYLRKMTMEHAMLVARIRPELASRAESEERKGGEATTMNIGEPLRWLASLQEDKPGVRL